MSVSKDATWSMDIYVAPWKLLMFLWQTHRYAFSLQFFFHKKEKQKRNHVSPLENMHVYEFFSGLVWTMVVSISWIVLLVSWYDSKSRANDANLTDHHFVARTVDRIVWIVSKSHESQFGSVVHDSATSALRGQVSWPIFWKHSFSVFFK